MKITVLITTYNRNEHCTNLVKQLLSYCSDKMTIRVAVWDDMSSIPFTFDDNRVRVFRNSKRRGKEGLYITWQEMFNFAKANRSDFYLFLQDDMSLRDNFFERLLNIWNSLDKPVTLAPVIDNTTLKDGISRWGGKRHTRYNENAMLTHWMDCKALVKDTFFELLNWKMEPISKNRWVNNKELSSGVGQQITTRLQIKKANMYHAVPSLCNLLDIKSEMNPTERERKPLFTDINEQTKILQQNNVIVSLTSYGDRMKNLPRVIDSMLRQTHKPYKVVLTLYKKDYGNIPSDVARYLRKHDNIVEVIVSDVDIKPHKKYFYTMLKYPDNPVITIDDDVEYDKSLIEKLMKSFDKHRNAVSCTRGREIRGNGRNLPPYSLWKINSVVRNREVFNFLPTGIGGILYPPHILNLKETNINELMEYLTVDDIFLKILELRNNIPTVLIDGVGEWYGKDIPTKNSLYSKNMSDNDKFIRKSNLSELLRNKVRIEASTVGEIDNIAFGYFDSGVQIKKRANKRLIIKKKVNVNCTTKKKNEPYFYNF